jgi:hypothetical protein
MTEPAILRKLRGALAQDISTEGQVVYVLVEIRKLIERIDESRQYETLYFYCSWAVHTRMTKAVANDMLEKFDEAHPLLKNRGLDELPRELSNRIQEMTAMRRFHQQLSDFLRRYELDCRIVWNQWTAFLRLYASIIEGCPLTVKAEGNKLKNIKKVVVCVDDAREQIHEGGEKYLLYRLRWTCHGKDDSTGTLETYFTIP